MSLPVSEQSSPADFNKFHYFRYNPGLFEKYVVITNYQATSCCNTLIKNQKGKTVARRPRIDLAGYHHIINRGVNRADVFNDSKDKEMFLKILCKSLKTILHSYCLMDNHYHLLIETNQNNLSKLMRSINANYAIYFNNTRSPKQLDCHRGW